MFNNKIKDFWRKFLLYFCVHHITANLHFSDHIVKSRVDKGMLQKNYYLNGRANKASGSASAKALTPPPPELFLKQEKPEMEIWF